MLSSDLSHYLEKCRPCEVASTTNVSLFPRTSSEESSDDDRADDKKRQSRPSAATPTAAVMTVSRIKTADDEEEMVSCISFRRTSSLAIVILFLANTLLDATVLLAVVGAAVSTVSTAHQLRHYTLEKRRERTAIQRQSTLESILQLELTLLELEWEPQPRPQSQHQQHQLANHPNVVVPDTDNISPTQEHVQVQYSLDEEDASSQQQL